MGFVVRIPSGYCLTEFPVLCVCDFGDCGFDFSLVWVVGFGFRARVGLLNLVLGVKLCGLVCVSCR